MAKRRREVALNNQSMVDVESNKASLTKKPKIGQSVALLTDELEEKRAKKERRRLRKLGKASYSADFLHGDKDIADGTAGEALHLVTLDVPMATTRADRLAEEKRQKAERKKADEGTNENGLGHDLVRPDSHTPKPSLNDDNYGIDSSIEIGLHPVASSGRYKQDARLSALPDSAIQNFLSSNLITLTDPLDRNSPYRPILSFDQLPADALPHPSLFANFKKPTPIQSTAWPFILAGRDVIGIAETGSGKTLAFGVPCIRHIASLPKVKKGGAARAVVVSPTRELAVQIYDQMKLLTNPADLEAVCVYGGVPKVSQRLALKTAHVVIATPGRLNDLIEEGAADLRNVKYLVLDEADRMLDKGFEDAIRKIIGSTSPNDPSSRRQTLMFTATWPDSARSLALTFMCDPVRINIGGADGELHANKRIGQKVEVVDPRSKETRLLQLIKQYQSGKSRHDKILVFCLYKKEAMRVESFLRGKGLRVAGIHGDLSQERRSASLESFKTGTTPLLVATDVAARGLDIPAVKLVINVTFPLTVEDYVHRIGRQVLLPPILFIARLN